MTQKIIYHDFRESVTEPNMALTAQILSKGRRLAKTLTQLNNAMNVTCIFLCGACSAVSLMILFLIARGN